MKAVTKVFLVLAAIAGVISGCATKSEFKDLKNRMDVLESNKIQSIEGQISSIDTSIGLLDQTDDQLEGYINALKQQVLELEGDCGEERETLEAAIKALQTEDDSLDKRIAELKYYTDSTLTDAKDWVKATIETLEEEYSKTVDVIAGIQANLDTLHTSITNEYKQAIEEAIGKSAESMKLWVNEQLTGYYDIATMNTKLDSLKSAINNQINEQSGDIEELIGQNTKDIETLESDLKQAKTDITEAYKKAIEEAITNYDGTITKTIQDEIDSVNETIDALDGRVTDLETAVSDLENRMDEVEKALKSLASIAHIPTYQDRKERVPYSVTGINATPEEVTLNFDVHPASSAKAIADAYSTAISAKAVFTLTRATAGQFVEMKVTGATADADKGILSVTLSAENLAGTEFLLGRLEASVVVRIATGYSNIQSDYIGLVPGGANATYMQYLYSEYDTDNDDKLSATELENVTELDLTDMGLTTLDITPFPNLEELMILGNPDLTKVACISFDSIMNCSVRCDEHTLFYIDGKQIKLEDYETTIDGVIWKQFNLDARIGDIKGNKYYGYQIADYYVKGLTVNICPDGYHVSTKDELTSLVKNYELDSYAGKSGIWASGSQDMKSGSSRIFIPHADDITRQLTSTSFDRSYNPVWYMEMNEKNDSFITFDYGKYDRGDMDVTLGWVRCVKDY